MIALNLDPKEGKDAQIHEIKTGLRRNRAPKTDAIGRVHLDEFTVTFPEVEAGDFLYKKTSIIPGIPGRNIAGEIIQPPDQKDINLQLRVGPGTHILHKD